MTQELPDTTVPDAMEAIVMARANGVPLDALSNLFDQLEWIVADPKPIGMVKIHWATGDDPVRAEIALSMKEAFLADNEGELIELLAKVKSKHPHLQEQCERIMREWSANEKLLGRGAGESPAGLD